MRPLAAILRALGRAVRRDLGTFTSIRVNNFFLFVLLLMYGAFNSGTEPTSSYPFLVLLGILLLLPLSSDPLARIPRNRLALWPLRTGQRFGLRLASLMFSPVLWLAVFMLIRSGKPLLVVGMVAAPAGVRALAPPAWQPLRAVPRIPGGLGELIRGNLRQMLAVLDTYLALLLSVGGTLWRLLGRNPDPAAFPILSILVALALSTYAQCLFSLDGESGDTRYRLLPLGRRQILVAKDLAYLALLFLLVLPLDAGTGMTFGLTALVAGRYPSLTQRLPVDRWRFTSGRILFGTLQVVFGTALAMAEHQYGAWLLALPAAAWLISLLALKETPRTERAAR